MDLLWIVTKVPWPTVDGGRLLVWNTLQGLAARGHRVTLVAAAGRGERGPEVAQALAECCEPHLVAAPPRPWLSAWLRARASGRPLTLERHARPRVAAAVARLLAARAFHLVHAEQLQAQAQAEAAVRRGLPVVLRAQNVESELWAASAAGEGFWDRRLGGEGRRLAVWEGRAVARAAATLALTARDAGRLAELAGGGGRIEVLPAPFPGLLPAAPGPLSGSPAAVLLGSGGWRPNRDAARWFVGSVWPVVRAALPGARLQVFGPPGRRPPERQPPGVDWRPAPADSRDAFAPGSVLVVPLRVASGVRMKILEAWARGIPVVATPAAAAGLEAEDGRELLLARDGPEFAAALGRLAAEPGLAAALVAAGRALLARRHDPDRVAARLGEIYAEVAGGGRREPA